MHLSPIPGPATRPLVGRGVTVMHLGRDDAAGPVVARLVRLGAGVERESELYAALSALMDDPAGYALLVMECDDFGGLEAGLRAVALLSGLRVRPPVILTSAECTEQSFPDDRRAPILLRAPATSLALRMGVEHALHGRAMFRAA